MTRPIDSVFHALSDPMRRQVIECISAQNGASATELAARLPITRQAIAKHLTALSEAGLVAAARDGRQLRYSLTPRPMGQAMSWMAEVGAEWDERLASLQRFIGPTP